METKSGARLIVESLIDAGVDVVFGFPGGQVIPLYDALYDAPFRHILTRHEQGAAHGADGYARSTGRVGVCIATSGPGATNLVTGLATAYMDSVPMVAITGQVPKTMIGNDTFQEADMYGITLPITKYNFLVKEVDQLPQTIKEAFHIASTGRPGPVLIDIPKDIQAAHTGTTVFGDVNLPGYRPPTTGHPRQIEAILEAVQSAHRPVIIAGGGVISSGADKELAEFIHRTNIPVATTLMGKGAFPETDPLSLGMPGMHGTKYANLAIHESDLIVAIGTRFDDRVAGDVRRFAPLARVVHIDIDSAEIGKRMPATIPCVGDVKSILEQLNEKIEKNTSQDWLNLVKNWKEAHPLFFDHNGGLKPQSIIQATSDLIKGRNIVTTDVGQHQMWAAQYIQTTHPRRFLTSGGLGTMGYGFPAAIGAAIGHPDQPVICLTGDGSFQMCIQELATARQYNLPVKIFILNNGCLGMVRQWQEIFNDRRYSSTCFEYNPDFCQVAQGYGVPSIQVADQKEVIPAIQKALTTDGPFLVDFVVEREENVLPMIPPGGGQTDFIGEMDQ